MRLTLSHWLLLGHQASMEAPDLSTKIMMSHSQLTEWFHVGVTFSEKAPAFSPEHKGKTFTDYTDNCLTEFSWTELSC